MIATTTKLYSYTNGNYTVDIYSDGTKVRSNDQTYFKPDFPESIDLKITNKCMVGCNWCHEESHPNGEHSDPDYILSIMHGLPEGVELAIGGGDILLYPYYEYLLEKLTNMGFICNITLNEQAFNGSIVNNLINNGLVKGVGYSYFKIPCPIDYEHIVNHIIIGLVPPDKILESQKKILLLGYKYKGRGNNIDKQIVDENIQKWYRYLYKFFKEGKHIIGLDNLAILQLNPIRLFFLNESEYYKHYMGDDGDFTMYIDAVNRIFAKSSSSVFRHTVNGNVTDCFNVINNPDGINSNDWS